MGGGGKIPRSPRNPSKSNPWPPSSDSYPKHVWSPSGGWYARPSNWRPNTMIAGAVLMGTVAVVWKFSADRETWAHKPESWEWHPSRHWSKQLIKWDKEEQETAPKSE
ncbi:hypothetical protein FZEAL_8703 [Fusarium zealandicum]|uniref:Uncharacterized protein n=1 Tax=Fusarium zealandicum TaxID=1053134 RepID=A0A8H4UDX5_9HYPO|nr:hypothetical protein FZEAL_8703 [Fusarium zealandicum]